MILVRMTRVPGEVVGLVFGWLILWIFLAWLVIGPPLFYPGH